MRSGTAAAPAAADGGAGVPSLSGPDVAQPDAGNPPGAERQVTIGGVPAAGDSATTRAGAAPAPTPPAASEPPSR
ncbi:MAG TPA: hypothetical protein VFY17_03895, partial [Pilimelia sp.]|nr:hypothetical protein [Pilimelia sp.]